MSGDQSCLMGWPWNEAQVNPLLSRGLLTIFAYDLSGRPQAVGTGFVISRDDRKAVCVTAAHVFLEVRRLQSPPPRHSPSTPREFLPPPRPIDIDRTRLRVVSVEGERVEATVVEGLAYDETADIAFFVVALQNDLSPPFFSHEFVITHPPPAVGELVCVLSYGDLGILDFEAMAPDAYSFKLKSRPVLRVGRVLEHYPEGHRLCRGPCIETSIPVFSGMSGGPALHFATEGAMRVFGLVCSDPDQDGPDKQNRSIEGRSIFALLPAQVIPLEAGKTEVRLDFKFSDAAGTLRVGPLAG